MTLHTLRWENPLNELNGVQFYGIFFIIIENLLTKLPWRVKFGSFLLCILGKEKKRLYLLLLGWTVGPQRPGILPFDGKSCLMTQDCQCFLQVVVCNCVSVKAHGNFSPCPGRWCQVFPHWRGYPTGCDWWTPWKSCWSSNIQKLHSTRNPSTDRKLRQQHQRPVSK